MEVKYTTVKEIIEREDIRKNERTVESCHLHFNGPGASGFGVKRTAMLLPESVMLLVAPPCCGRHGTVTGKKNGFDNRMFYLHITERDMVTGKYLERIPEAARIIADSNPKVIYICMTCVDAMLGTDISRIAKIIESETGIKTVGSFMDPISREGRRAPMVSVQSAIYSALEKSDKDRNAANIVGNFVPINSDELVGILKDKGYLEIRQISACQTYEEYRKMASAAVNIVINPQAVAAAKEMETRLGIPYIHIRNTYGPDRIEFELRKFGKTGDKGKNDLKEKLSLFAQNYQKMRFGIGEAINGSNLELALTFLEAGLDVRYVFKNIISEYDREMFELIAKIRPNLKVYSGVHPSTRSGKLEEVDVAIGLDAGYFSNESISICWNYEKQYFGYSGLVALLNEIEERIRNPLTHREQIKGSYLTI